MFKRSLTDAELLEELSGTVDKSSAVNIEEHGPDNLLKK